MSLVKLKLNKLSYNLNVKKPSNVIHLQCCMSFSIIHICKREEIAELNLNDQDRRNHAVDGWASMASQA